MDLENCLPPLGVERYDASDFHQSVTTKCERLMPIQFTCQCGKQLQAPEEFAGRQTKCPGCQRDVTVPRAATAIMPIQAAPPPSAAIDQVFARPSMAGQPLPPALAPSGTSMMAVFSLILGVLAICLPILLSIPAIVLGFLGLSAIGKSGGRLGGKGMAMAGLILGFVSIPLACASIGLVLMPAVSSARAAAHRIESSNNMKIIGLAVLSYADANNTMMPCEGTGTARLSWRVQILPYLGPDEKRLYQRFNQNEPWDGPTNKPLLAEMPRIYLDPRFQSPVDRDKGLTHYRGFATSQSILGAPSPLTQGVITSADGTSNTLFAVEAAEPVPWTKPESPSFNEAGPFGGPKHRDFFGLYTDGHVAALPVQTPPATIRALITWNGGEQVTPP